MASVTSPARTPYRGCGGLVHLHPQRRNIGLLLHRKIDHAGNVLHHLVDLFRQRAQHRQFVAEDLDRDVRAGTRQHMVDAVRDRLPDGDVHAREECHFLANLLEDCLLGTSRHLEIDIDLGGLHALDMLIQFRTSRSPGR